MRSYVNIHTEENTNGEIWGQGGNPIYGKSIE
jgi:hypothetical protein